MSKNTRTKFVVIITLCAIGLVVALSCRIGTIPGGKSLRITNVSVSPDPIVGRIVTLTVEIKADVTASNVSFQADTLDRLGNNVHLVSGDARWQGSLTAKESKTLQLSICVTEEGYWPVEFGVDSPSLEGDFRIVYLVSTITSGKLDPSPSQKEIANRPTPRPVKVSPECSGLSE